MAFGRIKDAVTDLAETLRRVFQDPPVQSGSTVLEAPAPLGVALLEAQAWQADHAPRPVVSPDAPVLREARLEGTPLSLGAQLQEEQGWEAWSAGARVCTMPVFEAGAAPRVAIPPLPKRAETLRIALEAWRTRVRGENPRLPSCATRRLTPELGAPRVREGLALVLALPVAVPGELWSAQGKALQMRYALELVKATGENIRNVEVLGLFLIPDKGVLEMRHDPRNQKLLLRLDGNARAARRRPFLLARRREDGALVSCFLEQG